MIFNKKQKRMIDVRELQKRGVVRLPKKQINIPTTSEGFIELGRTQQTTKEKPATKSNADFFGFMDNPTTDNHKTTTFNDSSDGYNKREVDTKITSLDNKIYKLEQRIELLEKKLDINQSTNNVGPMGW